MILDTKPRLLLARKNPILMREIPGPQGQRVQMIYWPAPGTPRGYRIERQVVPAGTDPNRPYLMIPGFGALSKENMEEIAEWVRTRPPKERPRRDFRGAFHDYMDWKIEQFKRNPSLQRELDARRASEV